MIEKMKYVNITGPRSEIDRIVSTYLSRYEIHLENALTELTGVTSLTPFFQARCPPIWRFLSSVIPHQLE